VRKRLRGCVERLSLAIGLGKSRKTKTKTEPVRSASEKGVTRPTAAAGKTRAAKADIVELLPADPPGSPATMHIVPPPPPAVPSTRVEHGPQLAAGYGEDRIEALVRDPRCVYVYWEMGGGGWRLAMGRHGADVLAAGRWVLRTEHRGGGESVAGCFDIPVAPLADNWYLPVEPATQYRVRIGVILPCGEFVELAASQPVVTPPEFVSDWLDEQWMITSEEFERLVAQIISSGATGSSGVFQHRSVKMLHNLRLSSAGAGWQPAAARRGTKEPA
jgi:hypothetical protein